MKGIHMSRNRKWYAVERRSGGFTLIEVMIVLAIVLALGAIVSVAVLSRRDQANVNLTKTDMNTLKAGLKWFRFEYNRYPTDEEGLAVLWSSETLDPELDESKWKAQLEEPLTKDRWDREWMYLQQSDNDPTRYALWSVGPDGEDGTEDDLKAWADDEADSGFGFDEMDTGSGG
jgi:general secretion pathway protein G